MKAPLNYTDPSGHSAVGLALGALGVAGALWDGADTLADLSSCFGDNNSIACYTLAFAAVTMIVPGPADDAARAAAEDTIVFRHGTTSKYRSSFGVGKVIEARGDDDIQDFGRAFYSTKRESEAITWADMRASEIGGEMIVVEIEIPREQFDALTGIKSQWVYRYGVTADEYQQGIRKSAEEILAIRASADYFFGSVTFYDSYEQFAFRSQRALDLLNACPRTICRVTPSRQLELLEKIIP